MYWYHSLPAWKQGKRRREEGGGVGERRPSGHVVITDSDLRIPNRRRARRRRCSCFARLTGQPPRSRTYTHAEITVEAGRNAFAFPGLSVRAPTPWMSKSPQRRFQNAVSAIQAAGQRAQTGGGGGGAGEIGVSSQRRVGHCLGRRSSHDSTRRVCRY